MCEQNETTSENIERLTSEEFFTEMEMLLKKAPEKMVYLVNAMNDPEDNNIEGRSIIAVSGSCAKIGFAFHAAFDQDRKFEHVVNHAVDYSNFARSRRRGSFRGMGSFDGDRFDVNVTSFLEKFLRK